VTHSKFYEKKEDEKAPKRVYMIIDDQKHYIDPEIVKRYGLDKAKVSPFMGRKLYIEDD
jgi:hypothetical protein